MSIVEKLISLGFSLHQEGKLEQAEEAYLEALKSDVKNSEIHNLLGVLKLQQNDVISAINWIEKAIEIENNEYFYETLFQAYVRAKLFRQIIKREKEVLKLFPNNFSLLFNIALAYRNVREIKLAIKFYNKALKIDPTSFTAWFNLSHLYSIEGETKNALSALKICKKIRPEDIDVDYFLSLALMRTKNYGKGLKLFETRLCRETAIALQNKTYPQKAAKEKLWNGQNIKNKTIYIYYEAGFGDVIMFLRYIPLLAEKCKKIIFLPQKQLVPLLRDNPLGIDEIVDKFIPECNIDFDVHAPLLSLPYLLGLKGEKVFAYPEGYLRPNEGLKQEFKKKVF